MTINFQVKKESVPGLKDWLDTSDEYGMFR